MPEPPTDWLIVGQRMESGGGVVLFASRDLSRADVHEQISTRTGRSGDIRLRFDDYLKVRADTFPEALVLLFQQWAQDPAGLRELWRAIQAQLGDTGS